MKAMRNFIATTLVMLDGSMSHQLLRPLELARGVNCTWGHQCGLSQIWLCQDWKHSVCCVHLDKMSRDAVFAHDVQAEGRVLVQFRDDKGPHLYQERLCPAPVEKKKSIWLCHSLDEAHDLHQLIIGGDDCNVTDIKFFDQGDREVLPAGVAEDSVYLFWDEDQKDFDLKKDRVLQAIIDGHVEANVWRRKLGLPPLDVPQDLAGALKISSVPKPLSLVNVGRRIT